MASASGVPAAAPVPRRPTPASLGADGGIAVWGRMPDGVFHQVNYLLHHQRLPDGTAMFYVRGGFRSGKDADKPEHNRDAEKLDAVISVFVRGERASSGGVVQQLSGTSHSVTIVINKWWKLIARPLTAQEEAVRDFGFAMWRRGRLRTVTGTKTAQVIAGGKLTPFTDTDFHAGEFVASDYEIGPRRGQTGRRGTVLQLDKKTRLVIDPDRKESFKARVRKLQVGKDKKTTYYAVCCNELGHGALSNMKINERLARKTEAAADAGTTYILDPRSPLSTYINAMVLVRGGPALLQLLRVGLSLGDIDPDDVGKNAFAKHFLDADMLGSEVMMPYTSDKSYLMRCGRQEFIEDRLGVSTGCLHSTAHANKGNEENIQPPQQVVQPRRPRQQHNCNHDCTISAHKKNGAYFGCIGSFKFDDPVRSKALKKNARHTASQGCNARTPRSTMDTAALMRRCGVQGAKRHLPAKELLLHSNATPKKQRLQAAQYDPDAGSPLLLASDWTDAQRETSVGKHKLLKQAMRTASRAQGLTPLAACDLAAMGAAAAAAAEPAAAGAAGELAADVAAAATPVRAMVVPTAPTAQ